MKLKKLSLRARLTLFVGVLLTAACVFLTMSNYYSAYYGMRATATDAIQMAVSITSAAQPGEETLAAVTLVPSAPTQATSAEVFTPDVRADLITQTVYAPQLVFLRQSIVVMLGVILLSCALVYWASGRALRPVVELAESIEKVSEDNLYERVPENPASKEAMALGGAFNKMLARLEAAFVAQKQFAANAAHELKTPLASIQANVEALYLDENPEKADYEETLVVVNQNTSRLIVLVEQLLSIARKDDLPFALCDINAIARAAIDKAQSQYPMLHVAITGSAGALSGNAALLEQMVYNLLENAAKYAGENAETRLTLAENDAQISIVVEDSGPGLDEESIAKVFEPFYRAEASRSRRLGGSGLGLSIVKTVAERHGGTAEAGKSALGGAKFTVYLQKA